MNRSVTVRDFQRIIVDYYHTYGRKDLPWRNTRDPYHILISEVMLQQTQVERVLDKYPEFLRHFPDFEHLVHASFDHVLRVWQGMGYNRRALYLVRMAQRVMGEFGGKLPEEAAILETFSGIGRHTAGAIMVFAFGKPAVFVETNIRRVFIHFFEALKEPMSTRANFRLPRHRRGDEFERRRIDDSELFPLIEQTLDKTNPRMWYFALMDYGAMLGKKGENPNRRSRQYHKQSKFEGSNRQVRGEILRLLLKKGTLGETKLESLFSISPKRLHAILNQLLSEGFIERIHDQLRIKK